MVEIGNDRASGIQTLRELSQAVNADDAKKEMGVVAKGVGMFKKMWLHMTGQAGDRHSQQLTNLRAQVKHDFGDTGLKHLNTLLQAKGWSAPNSSKLLSDNELQTLMGTVKVQARITDLKKEVANDVERLLDHPVAGKLIDSFTKKEFSNENTDFIRTLNGALEMNKEGLPLALLFVTDNFVGNDADRPVNLNSRNSNAAGRAKEELQQARKDGDQTGIDQAADKLRKALLNCKEEIVKLVQSDTFTRLKIDSDYGDAFNQAVDGIVMQQVKNEVIQESLKRSGLA